MARYQYETSPRKLDVEYEKSKVKTKPKNKTKVKEKPKSKVIAILKILLIFVVLLTISYRNSLINEKFTNIKDMKNQIASLEKENEQLKVNIESKTNLTTIEKKAEEELGMKKQAKSQTQYINIEKQDFIETASEKVVNDKQESIFQKILDIITNI